MFVDWCVSLHVGAGKNGLNEKYLFNRREIATCFGQFDHVSTPVFDCL